ncbi:MAG: DUF262 domain-containing protein [Flavobacteriales bacterium]|nr:DUF262 domain-containing protein [Flavobacteriales bacterium]
MIQHTGKKQVSELFGSDNKITYHIPRYQREYIWSKWNWEALFDDLLESEGAHFLGSIICINTELDSSKPARLELVDGQQRMTTISILYLVLYKILKEELPDATDQDRQLSLMLLKNRIVVSNTDKLRLTPSYTSFNFDDYEWLVSEEIDKVRVARKPKFLGNRRLSKAFWYFHERLTEVDDQERRLFNYEAIEGFLEKVNEAILVKIDVATHADAFTLFETLNNRGVPLSAIDIIKNKLLGQLERIEPEGSLTRNFERWNAILENLTEEYNVQERFLRQFYNAFRQIPGIEVEKAPKALRSNLIRIYETLIDRDVHGTFDRLEEASGIYASHIKYEDGEQPEELVRALRNLENVTGADAYMLLLFVSKRFGISTEEKVKLVDLLCRYFIRRNVTDTPPTRDLTNYFMLMIAEADGMANYNYDRMREIILSHGKPASDDLFEEKLKGDLYMENVGATRYILSSLELAMSATRERYTNFYARNNTLFVWTVEHVLPQGENIPQHWVDMIAKGNKEEAERIRASWCHKLGNLTLTGYNSQLSNEALSKKQDKKGQDGKFIGFKNGLALNEPIKDVDRWTEGQIKDRTDTLVKKALEIFKL